MPFRRKLILGTHNGRQIKVGQTFAYTSNPRARLMHRAANKVQRG